MLDASFIVPNEEEDLFSIVSLAVKIYRSRRKTGIKTCCPFGEPEPGYWMSETLRFPVSLRLAAAAPPGKDVAIPVPGVHLNGTDRTK
jgi:hypothetical protein